MEKEQPEIIRFWKNAGIPLAAKTDFGGESYLLIYKFEVDMMGVLSGKPSDIVDEFKPASLGEPPRNLFCVHMGLVHNDQEKTVRFRVHSQLMDELSNSRRMWCSGVAMANCTFEIQTSELIWREDPTNYEYNICKLHTKGMYCPYPGQSGIEVPVPGHIIKRYTEWAKRAVVGEDEAKAYFGTVGMKL